MGKNDVRLSAYFDTRMRGYVVEYSHCACAEGALLPLVARFTGGFRKKKGAGCISE